MFQVEVRVYNANTFTRNDLIGEFSFGYHIQCCWQQMRFFNVYNVTAGLRRINNLVADQTNKHICNHQLYMQWVCLAHPSNPQEDRGFLRCTVTVLTENDRMPSHSVKEFIDDLGAPPSRNLVSTIFF